MPPTSLALKFPLANLEACVGAPISKHGTRSAETFAVTFPGWSAQSQSHRSPESIKSTLTDFTDMGSGAKTEAESRLEGKTYYKGRMYVWQVVKGLRMIKHKEGNKTKTHTKIIMVNK